MKILLIPIVSIALFLPSMTMANESHSSAQAPVAKQAEQKKEFKHDHRKRKGLPSSSESDEADNNELYFPDEESQVKPSDKKNFKHEHRKLKGLPSTGGSSKTDNDETDELAKKKVHRHKKVPK